VRALRENRYEVEIVTALNDAERSISEASHDLLILDVMIPTKSFDEMERYGPDETDLGNKSGLIFYRRMRKKLGDALPKVLVVTVRLDQGIMREFIEDGLPRERFVTKYEVRDTHDFLRKVQSALEE